MENQKIKKMNKKKTNALKHRLERSNKLDGVLSSKIEQSITRARFVQNSRKSGWDQINKGINLQNGLVESHEQKEKSDDQIEKEEEDAYVQQFFEDEPSDKGASNNGNNAAKGPSEQVVNRFSILEESEA